MGVRGLSCGLDARDKEMRVIVLVERLQWVFGLVDGDDWGSGKERKESLVDECTAITDCLFIWFIEGDVTRAVTLEG